MRASASVSVNANASASVHASTSASVHVRKAEAHIYILSWIKVFLTNKKQETKNRKQQVNVYGCNSKIFDVISGIPQGSVSDLFYSSYPSTLWWTKQVQLIYFFMLMIWRFLKRYVPKRTQRVYKKTCISSTTGPDTRS